MRCSHNTEPNADGGHAGSPQQDPLSQVQGRSSYRFDHPQMQEERKGGEERTIWHKNQRAGGSRLAYIPGILGGMGNRGHELGGGGD